MSYFELDFSIDFNINVEHQCVQLHLNNAMQFSDFFLQVQALQQARLQPHLTSSWQAMMTSESTSTLEEASFQSSSTRIQVDLEPSFQQHLLIPLHLLDTVPVDKDGIGHSVLEESVLDLGCAGRKSFDDLR